MLYGCAGWVALRICLIFALVVRVITFCGSGFVWVWYGKRCSNATAGPGAFHARHEESYLLEIVMGMALLCYSLVLFEQWTVSVHSFSDKMSKFTEMEWLPRKIQLAEAPAIRIWG